MSDKQMDMRPITSPFDHPSACCDLEQVPEPPGPAQCPHLSGENRNTHKLKIEKLGFIKT